MKKAFLGIALSAFLIISCNTSKNEVITVAAAANMQFVMKDLEAAFEKETGIACEVILGSSGKLTAQILEGAPFDIFLSADLKYPHLIQSNKRSATTPKVYAYGHLVLWSMDKEQLSIDLLKDNSIEHIAIANPQTAPYGKAAMEVLNYYDVSEQVANKLVYGESISQTNQFIVSKAADIGLTSKSIVLSNQMKNQGHWIALDSASYAPIAQAVVILNHAASRRSEVDKFYEFLFSEMGSKILDKFGYSNDDWTAQENTHNTPGN